MSSIALEGRHRVGVVSELPGLLRDLGLDPEPIVSRAGLDLDVLKNPESGIPFHSLGRLLEISASTSGRPHFGLLVGARGGTKSLGLVGELMRNAPTLGDAILDLCTNQQRYIRGAVAYLAVREQTAFWGYGVHLPGTPAVEQIGDAAIEIGSRMLRELTGRAPEVILAARPTPSDAAPYREIFGSTPEFNAEQHALAFPSSWLSLAVKGADDQLRRNAERTVEQYWAALSPGFAERASRALRSRIVCGNASVRAVAGSFHLTARTLNRRLRAEGRTFRQLANEARFIVAQQLLAGTQMHVTSIALALGYAEASAFTRAFRRSAGVSPTQWRVRL
jgi:AraC-like DNA-binding protein